MMQFRLLLAGWLLSDLTSAGPFGYTSNSALFGRQDDSFDEYDFSNIKKMAAIGDSYSAGIGAGHRLGRALDVHNVANHYTDWWCSRYDHSYPYLVNKRLGDLNSKGGKFQFLSCSGAQTKEVVDSQLSRMDSGQDVILISSGGNDVGFADIINQCVYQFFSPTKVLSTLGELAGVRASLKTWLAEAAIRVGLDGEDIPLPDIDLLKYARTCEEELENSKKMINSPEFAKGISDLISKAKKKLAPGGQIYYTSYAKFWSPDATDDDWCANPEHTWSVFLSKTVNVADWQSPVILTRNHRMKMNEFVDAVNEKIFDAVVASGDGVSFVNWDDYALGMGGNFCRKEVREPDTTRWDAAFFEWNINDAMGTSPFRRSNEDLVPGSFEAVLNGFAGAAFEMGVEYKDEANAGEGGIQKRSIFIPDGFGRIFHPRPIMHNVISDLIGFHMASKNARDHSQNLGPARVFPGDQCLLPQLGGGGEEATGGKCEDKDASGILAKEFSSIYSDLCTQYNKPDTDKSVNIDLKKEINGLKDAEINNGKTLVELSWVPNKKSNECNTECTEAFSQLTETCGDTGAHEVKSGESRFTVGGVQMAKSASFDAGCGTFMYFVTPPQPKPSEPPKPPKPEKECFTGDEFKAFSRDAAFDLATRVCQQLHDRKAVIGRKDSLGPLDIEYYRKGKNIAADGATLVINPNYALSGCEDMDHPTDVDFGKMSVEECTGTFIEVVDGCAPFENSKGDKFWKYGGKNKDKCAFWTVYAQ